ncbi:MAG: arsinothricin resistance N-acetyltransferase ArsN1 family B [Cyclobacteriaceae bacterium]
MKTIRLAELKDAPAILEIYRPIVRETTISFEVDPPGLLEMQDRIAKTLVEFPWLVCENDGTVIGYAYGGPHRSRIAYQWSVELSVYVHEAYRKQGVARGLYTSLMALLTHQGFVNAYCGVTLPNEASENLHASMGFKPIGIYEKVGFKMEQWHSVKWWSQPLTSYPPSPTAPASPARLIGTEHWEQALSEGESLLS